MKRIKSILVANRGEIAIRVLRAASELSLRTVAIYSREDRFSLHRMKADESYLVGEGRGPIEAYLDMHDVIRIALESKVDAIHPGYGFLAENPDFAAQTAAAGLVFVGPTPDNIRTLGNKISARALAMVHGVPVVPATGPLPRAPGEAAGIVAEIGYPVMLKASWGGGGRGMRTIENETQLLELLPVARSEAAAAFGSDEVYAEKLLRRARHVEVQILGDAAGGLVHLYERDCTVQRRNQKVVERAPAVFLDGSRRDALCEAALRIGRAVSYVNAGTVEFLQDADTGQFYFMEVNPRIQVEHTVTEVVTGIDLVKAQIRIADGARLGTPESGVPRQDEIQIHGHAIQCRVTSEDPENGFAPDSGRIMAYRAPAGFGIRLDAGSVYTGAIVTQSYDSLLVKVTAWAATPEEAVQRMHRALWEFRIRGIVTNLRFLDQIILHRDFAAGEYTTRFIDESPELFQFPRRRDRATRLLHFLGDRIVNGNEDVKGRERPSILAAPRPPPAPAGTPPPGTRQQFAALGPDRFAQWMREQQRVLVTDTSMRDAHQSLLATRVRSIDLLAPARAYAHLLPQLLSLECWGGATFDVALRFLKEDPWERLAGLRESVPNILLQMLLRSANAVGYRNYPDNVVRHFVRQAASAGIDVFRVFDSLNWVDNMRVAIDAVRESGSLCEAAICYTGNILDPVRCKYDLAYYLERGKSLAAAGAHVLAIKDMAGLCQPRAASLLVRALNDEVGLPIHFHTHDTSGIAGASVLAAIEAGAHAVDGALDALSGLTSQPNLGSIVEALRFGPRDTGIDPGKLRQLSNYWGQVRHQYGAFESDLRSGASEIYVHGMPGGQYTNLREQARSLGLGEHRWPEVARAYTEVNDMLGDIIKVTPTSKAVGDLALLMVTTGLSRREILDPGVEVAFPDSVIEFFRGDLGQPYGGFPAELQRKVLKGASPLTERPGASLPPAMLDAERGEAERQCGHQVSERDLASYLMYPRVYTEYAKHRRKYGDVSCVPTDAFFWGLEPGQEISIDLERGKTLFVRFVALGEMHDDCTRTVFFELNGHPRLVRIVDRSRAMKRPARRRVETPRPGHVGAPMAGVIVTVAVSPGGRVARGDPLATLEAMKMQTTLHAEVEGEVVEVLARPGMQVDLKDLLFLIQPATDKAVANG
jgi:pyruvate carboxylase